MWTAEHIMALLYFHTEGTIMDAPKYGFTPSIVTSLKDAGLIELKSSGDIAYKTTKKGYVYIGHILYLPLPEQVTEWRMPS